MQSDLHSERVRPYGEPVTTLAELESLDDDEIVEGYQDGLAGEPEPRGNRSKSYWHGWRNGNSDRAGKVDAAGLALAKAVLRPTPNTTGGE